MRKTEALTPFEVMLAQTHGDLFGRLGHLLDAHDLAMNGMIGLAISRASWLKRAVRLAETRYGANDIRTLRAWYRWQQYVGTFRSLRSVKAADRLFGRPGEVGKAVRWGFEHVLEGGEMGRGLRAASRTFAVVGAVADIDIMLHGAGHQGVYDDIDRGVAAVGFGASVVAGGAWLAGALEVAPFLVTVAGPAAIAVLGGVAVYGLATLAIDNREQIAHAAVSAYHWVGDEQQAVAHAAVAAAHWGTSEAGHVASYFDNKAHGVEHALAHVFHKPW